MIRTGRLGRRRDRRRLLGAIGLGIGLVHGATIPTAARARADNATAHGSGLFDRVARLAGFTLGDTTAAPAAVVFFDVRCPHCATLWHDVRRLPSPRPTRWIPVVLLEPASARQGAALLRSPDPVAAMDAHVRDLAAGRPGIDATQAPSADETGRLRENTAALRALDVASVPALLYRDPRGDPALAIGAMRAADLARLLADR